MSRVRITYNPKNPVATIRAFNEDTQRPLACDVTGFTQTGGPITHVRIEVYGFDRSGQLFKGEINVPVDDQDLLTLT